MPQLVTKSAKTSVLINSLKLIQQVSSVINEPVTHPKEYLTSLANSLSQ